MEDWNLPGIKWRQQYTLTPVSHLAPFLFNRLSDAILWKLQHSYGITHLLHYCNDFFTAAPADTIIYSSNLDNILCFLSVKEQMYQSRRQRQKAQPCP